jgi:N6-L-threonylcarbamoyladenine synthase
MKTMWVQRKVRCHNRRIHKCTIGKGGIRKRNQAPCLVKGFRLYDRVRYDGEEYFIFGRRASGYFDIRTLDGTRVNKGSINCRKLKFLETSRTYLTERRMVAPPTA